LIRGDDLTAMFELRGLSGDDGGPLTGDWAEAVDCSHFRSISELAFLRMPLNWFIEFSRSSLADLVRSGLVPFRVEFNLEDLGM
jgi:hypothetical protein